MNVKRIKKESKIISEELFSEYNITDIKTKKLINDYFFSKLCELPLN